MYLLNIIRSQVGNLSVARTWLRNQLNILFEFIFEIGHFDIDRLR